MQLTNEHTSGFPVSALELMAALFISIMGLFLLWAITAFVVDVAQIKEAVRAGYDMTGECGRCLSA